MWSVGTGEAIGPPLVGHASAVRRLAFSPDRRDWGIPNVYLRAEDGTIFAPPKAEKAETAKPAGKQEGGVNFSGISGNISIGGDLVGRDKITKK